MNFFSKSPTKKSKKTPASDDETPDSPRSRSPIKKVTSRKAKDDNSKSESASPRSSRIFGKKGSNSQDRDTHPLNLPPEELKRLSALSTMSDKMDIDSEHPNGTSSSTPPPGNPASEQQKTNGVNGVNDAPVPPPHKSNPTSPQQSSAPTVEDAEAFKNAGNKHYKAKEYWKAIEEYTKAVEAQPSSATYLNNRAAAYISAAQYQYALEDCTRADELEPNNPKILLRLARIYTMLGRPQEAVDTYARIQPPPSAKDMAPAKTMLNQLALAEDSLRDGVDGSMVIVIN